MTETGFEWSATKIQENVCANGIAYISSEICDYE